MSVGREHAQENSEISTMFAAHTPRLFLISTNDISPRRTAVGLTDVTGSTSCGVADHRDWWNPEPGITSVDSQQPRTADDGQTADNQVEHLRRLTVNDHREVKYRRKLSLCAHTSSQTSMHRPPTTHFGRRWWPQQLGPHNVIDSSSRPPRAVDTTSEAKVHKFQAPRDSSPREVTKKPTDCIQTSGTYVDFLDKKIDEKTNRKQRNASKMTKYASN